jgi:hypothetical protein
MAAGLVLLSAGLSYCDETGLMAIGLRGGVSVKGESPLGERMRESFSGADIFGVFRLPWSWYSAAGWGVGTRLITSAGVLTAKEKIGLIGSIVPVVAFGTQDDKFSIDGGLGGAAVNVYHFGRHNLGGPFQFVATLGASVRLFRPFSLGYRFQHYSDGTVYGSETRGVDLHMIELIYRY